MRRGSLLVAMAVAVACSGGGGRPAPPQWSSTAIDTVEGVLWVQTRRPVTDSDRETVRRRVMETWRDCRRLNPPTNQLCEIFTPASVVVREVPGSNGQYGGTLDFHGRRRQLAIVGSNWISLNHEVGDHAMCHFDRDTRQGKIPGVVECTTVGHPGHLRPDGTPVP